MTCWYGMNTNPENLPLRRPGVYRVTNIENGKNYIGISKNVLVRTKGHAKGSKIAILRAATEKYGRNRFLIEPLYYLTNDSSDVLKMKNDESDLLILHLKIIEAELIVMYDSISPNGYNLKECDGNVGPYGEAWVSRMRLLWDSPEYRANLKEAMNKPETRKRLSDAGKRNSSQTAIAVSEWYAQLSQKEKDILIEKRTASARTPEGRKLRSDNAKTAFQQPEIRAKYIEAQNRPDVKARRSASLKETFSTPEQRARISAQSKEIMTRPEVKAKQRAAAMGNKRVLGKRYITNGSKDRMIESGDSVPEGWIYGRSDNGWGKQR